MGMSGEKELFDDNYHFELSKNVVIQDGNDVTVFTTGSIISEVIEATKMLNDDGISARIINVHTLKPMDIDGIVSECKNQQTIVTVEEHNTIGGLGTAIADVIIENGLKVRMKKIGLNDAFANSFGVKSDVLIGNHLDANSICDIVLDFIKNDGSN